MKEAELEIGEESLINESISWDLINKVKKNCEGTPEEVVDRLIGLRNSIDGRYFEIGGLLYKVFKDKLYLELKYPDWENFLEDKIEFKIRKAKYLMQIYKYFVVRIGDMEIIQKIAPLGWSKVKKLVNIVDPKNVDEWIEKCEGATLKQVSQKVSEFLAAKEKPRTKAVEKEAKTLFSLKMYEKQSDNVDSAIKLASKLSRSEDKSDNLSLIAQDYLTYNSSLAETDPVIKTEMMRESYRKLELAFGVKLIVLDQVTDEVMFGQEHVTV